MSIIDFREFDYEAVMNKKTPLLMTVLSRFNNADENKLDLRLTAQNIPLKEDGIVGIRYHDPCEGVITPIERTLIKDVFVKKKKTKKKTEEKKTVFRNNINVKIRLSNGKIIGCFLFCSSIKVHGCKTLDDAIEVERVIYEGIKEVYKMKLNGYIHIFKNYYVNKVILNPEALNIGPETRVIILYTVLCRFPHGFKIIDLMQTIQKHYPKIITTYEEQTCPALKIEKKVSKYLPKISIIIRKSGSTTINICVSKYATRNSWKLKSNRMIHMIITFITSLIRINPDIVLEKDTEENVKTTKAQKNILKNLC